jgi:subtilisin family serine protease
MQKILKQQVERILDETPDKTVKVLVQMEVDAETVRELVNLATEAVHERQAVLSARDLLPPSYERLMARHARKGGKTAKSGASRKPVRTREGFSADPADLSFRMPPERAAVTSKQAADCGARALQPLLQWAGEPASAKSRKPRNAVPFPVSGSALMELNRDRLYNLTDEVEGVVGIYRNRRVIVPPYARAKRLPAAVEDNKAHTWGVSRTSAISCWGAFEARGAGMKIAVLDTGIDAQHPDLKGKVADFAEFDHDGKLVAKGVAKAYDSHHHGTHVAGTIVGGNAGGRWIGMAPEAKILAALVLKNGGGTDAQILAGMQWALEQGADVISMSLGGLRMTPEVIDTYTQMIITANRQGVPVVVAVGNEGSQTTGAPGNDFFAFTVGATDVLDRAAGFSGGRTQIVESSRYINPDSLPLVYSKPDITAPGVDIYSTIPGGKYDVFSGTSMATPHVSGAMALLLSGLPKMASLRGFDRVNAIQQLLISSVTELGEAGQNHRFGFGRVDVLRAFGFGIELGYRG